MLLLVFLAFYSDQRNHQETQSDQLRLIKIAEQTRPHDIAQQPVRQRRRQMPAHKSPITFLIKMYSQNGYTDQPGHIQDLAHRLIVFPRLHPRHPQKKFTQIRTLNPATTAAAFSSFFFASKPKPSPPADTPDPAAFPKARDPVGF